MLQRGGEGEPTHLARACEEGCKLSQQQHKTVIRKYNKKRSSRVNEVAGISKFSTIFMMSAESCTSRKRVVHTPTHQTTNTTQMGSLLQRRKTVGNPTRNAKCGAQNTSIEQLKPRKRRPIRERATGRRYERTVCHCKLFENLKGLGFYFCFTEHTLVCFTSTRSLREAPSTPTPYGWL